MASEADWALIAMQRSLLGEVSAALRAVTVQVSDDRIHFDAYFDGPIAEEDVDGMACVDTELVAMLSEDIQVTHALHRLDAPAVLPKSDTFAYLRRE